MNTIENRLVQSIRRAGERLPNSTHPGTPNRIIQFNWSRNWRKKVEPYLEMPIVRGSVAMGMKLLDQKWTWDDGPHAVGRGRWNGQRVTKNKLSWYQPWGRCHWISFFACAIGVLNYPKFDWHFLSGHCHTVAVGSCDGEHRVVMDILNFKSMTANEAAVDFVWELLEKGGLSNGKSKPPVKCFTSILDAGVMLNGYYRDGIVYLHEDLGGTASIVAGRDALSDRLLKVALEEVSHHVTQATDNSRDFQNYLLDLAVRLFRSRLH